MFTSPFAAVGRVRRISLLLVSLALFATALATPTPASADGVDPVKVEWFGATQDPIYPGDEFVVTANLNRSLVGDEQVKIKRDGYSIGICGASWMAFCSAYTNADWSLNTGTSSIIVSAEVWSGGALTDSVTRSIAVARREFNVELFTSAESAEVGEAVTVYARIADGTLVNSPYLINIRDDVSGQVVAQCHNNTSDCVYAYAASWDLNTNPAPRHFSAWVSRTDGGDIASNTATGSIAVTRKEFNVEIFRSQDSVRIPDSASVYARVTNGSIPNSPYWLKIRDDNTGQVVASCRTWNNDCAYAFTTDWSQNASPVAKKFSAYAESDTGDVASNVVSIAIPVEPFQYDLGIVSDPPTVAIGGTSYVTAYIKNTDMWGKPYALHVKDEETGQVVASCYNLWNACTYAFSTSWADNVGPDDHRFSAFMAPTALSLDRPSNSPSASVAIEKRRFNVLIEANQNVFSEPGTLAINARIADDSLAGTPYQLSIRDAESGAHLAQCGGTSASCGFTKQLDWSAVTGGGTLSFVASVGEADSLVSNESELEVHFVPPTFNVGLSVGEPIGDEELPLEAEATSSPTVAGTPLRLSIRNDVSDDSVASCVNDISPGSRCPAQLHEGTYFAVVEDAAGNEYGRSGSWTIGEDGSVSSNEVAGLDLAALAKLMGSAAAICDAVLVAPYRTFVMQPPSSLSDQYRTCLGAVAAGRTPLEILRGLLQWGSVGVLLLEWLNHYGSSGSPPGIEAPDLPWGQSDSRTGTVAVPADFLTEQDLFWDRNRSRFQSRADADTAFKACLAATQTLLYPSGQRGPCSTKPIFFSGRFATPQATAHDWDAQRSFTHFIPDLRWVVLKYRVAPKGAGNWKRGDARCAGAAASTSIDCDEYPFLSTEQGGGDAVLVPSLRPIAARDNRSQGGSLGAFYRLCGLRASSDRQFVSIPMPPATMTPTTWVCN